MVYQQEVDKVTKQVSDRMMVTFETWNKKRVQLVKDKTESEIIEQEKKVFYDQENSDITDILNGFGPTIEEYILDA
jgi:endonuclease III